MFIIFYTSIVINKFPNINDWFKFIFIYLGRIVFAVIPFFIILKRDIKEFFKNIKIYIQEIIKIFSITILFYIPISFILNLVLGGNSTNQNIIKEIPIWITAILVIVVAPISEEILFRGFLRRFIKNDNLYIALSGIIFGVVHCIYAEENWLMYLFILPYAIMGAGFAKIYVKTNNIVSNICLHFIWNSIILCAMIISKI